MFRHVSRNIDLEQKILTVPCEEVMVERYIHIKRDGLLTLVLAGGRSVYIPVPVEIRNRFRRLYNLDLAKRGSVEMCCELVDEAHGEDDIENANFEAKLIYTLRKPKTNIEKTVARAKL